MGFGATRLLTCGELRRPWRRASVRPLMADMADARLHGRPVARAAGADEAEDLEVQLQAAAQLVFESGCSPATALATGRFPLIASAEALRGVLKRRQNKSDGSLRRDTQQFLFPAEKRALAAAFAAQQGLRQQARGGI